MRTVVMEGNVFEDQSPLCRLGQGDRIRRVPDIRDRIQNFIDTPG